MARLDDVVRYIKSSNAGASMITFDIGFASDAGFRRMVESGAINAASVAPLLRVDEQDVAIFAYKPALVIKITIPRTGCSGGIEERDFDGVQQFAPLLDLQV